MKKDYTGEISKSDFPETTSFYDNYLKLAEAVIKRHKEEYMLLYKVNKALLAKGDLSSYRKKRNIYREKMDRTKSPSKEKEYLNYVKKYNYYINIIKKFQREEKNFHKNPFFYYAGITSAKEIESIRKQWQKDSKNISVYKNPYLEDIRRRTGKKEANNED